MIIQDYRIATDTQIRELPEGVASWGITKGENIQGSRLPRSQGGKLEKHTWIYFFPDSYKIPFARIHKDLNPAVGE